MPTEEPKLTDEERARIAELEKSRALSDAKLVKDGARYVSDGRGGKKLRLSCDQNKYFKIVNEIRDCADHKSRVATLLDKSVQKSKEYDKEYHEYASYDRIPQYLIYLDGNGDICENSDVQLLSMRITESGELSFATRRGTNEFRYHQVMDQGYPSLQGRVEPKSCIPLDRIIDIYPSAY